VSAAELRKAAETLRERAKAADAPPWEQDGVVGSPWNDLIVNDASNGIIADCDTSDENAAYIATMHPGVGLALAEWLDQCADRLHRGHHTGSRHSHAIARLINGGAE
jgi:hypothetical protein